MPNTNKTPASVKCPVCGEQHPLEAHPTKPGRMIANCPQNQLGPVYETDAAEKTTPQE